MIPFPQALDLLFENCPRCDKEPCRLELACGRVLRQEIRADRAFPPFDRVMMDGYAFRAAELPVDRMLRVSGTAPAGQPKLTLPSAHASCIEVMTGAVVPDGADCIVPVEQTTRTDVLLEIAPGFQPMAGRFIHRAGSDAGRGELLLRPGARLGSREIGVAASVGAAMLMVSRLPRITIVPTGDELVAVDATPAPHEIRQSNGHAIRCALQAAGYPSQLAGTMRDDADIGDLRAALESSDWLILSGAVSMGARDFLPYALEKLGCEMLFHRVAQRPGKPFGCWTGPDGRMILALPGNPVSALTMLHAFVVPALAVASGLPRPEPRLVTPAAPIEALPEMTWHLPVRLTRDGRAVATPTGNSGDFIGLSRGEGFLSLPPREAVQDTYPFTPWL